MNNTLTIPKQFYAFLVTKRDRRLIRLSRQAKQVSNLFDDVSIHTQLQKKPHSCGATTTRNGIKQVPTTGPIVQMYWTFSVCKNTVIAPTKWAFLAVHARVVVAAGAVRSDH